jgi:hypothetical protein
MLCAFSLVILAPIQGASQRALAAAANPTQRVRENLAYHVIRLVRWPDSAFESMTSPIRIAILEPPREDGVAELFGARSIYLDEHAGSRPHGRRYAVRESRGADAGLRDTHVLYVTERAQRDMVSALKAIRGAPVLSIGETKEFVRAGGMVGLVVEHGRIRPYVDLDAVQAAGLRMGAELLRHARIVSSRGGTP